MFSQLGPLFKTHLRQAEHADARFEIKREDKNDQGKKQEFEEKEDTTPMWEDSTQVSVEALRTFLLQFLKTRGEPTPEENNLVDPNSIYAGLSPEERTPASPTAARAVKAYATMAVYSHTEQPPPPPSEPQKEEPVDLADLLRSDELRTIHVLIAELEQLSRRGLQVLTIEKADTFLEALVQAVRLEKSKG